MGDCPRNDGGVMAEQWGCLNPRGGAGLRFGYCWEQTSASRSGAFALYGLFRVKAYHLLGDQPRYRRDRGTRSLPSA